MASVVVEGLRLPVAIGGHPAVDFCNTRAGWPSDTPKEYLRGLAELAVWARQAGLVDPPAAQRARDSAAEHPRAAAEVVRRAVAFRDALYAVLTSPGQPGDDAAVARAWQVLGGQARLAVTATVLVPGRPTARWEVDPAAPPLTVPYLAVVRSAADLLTSPLAAHVRACPMPDCGWLFADPSGRRRWCSMAWCGNRSKVRRYAERARSGAR